MALKIYEVISISPKVIVLTGTPGVGKTAVAKALASKLGAQYIGLGNIVKEENLILGKDEARGTLVTDMRKLSGRIRGILRKSRGCVVIEGHYAPDVVPKSFMPYIFVLRRDPGKLRAEFEVRGYDEGKISENLASEMLDVCLISAIKKHGLERVDEIDVTDMRVEDVVDEILKVVEGRRGCRTGVVDWFNRLDEEGRLDEVLALLEKS